MKTNWWGGNKKGVLFFGGTGELAQALLAENLFYDTRVCCVGRNSKKSLLDRKNILYCYADITKDTKDTVRNVVGDSKFDTIIFGLGSFNFGKLIDVNKEKFVQELDVALTSPLLISQYFVSRWGKEKKNNIKNNKSILFISSTDSLGFFPNEGRGTYSVSKASQNMLVKHMAAEFSDYGVRVNCVCPHSIKEYAVCEETKKIITDLVKGNETGKVYSISEKGKVVCV